MNDPRPPIPPRSPEPLGNRLRVDPARRQPRTVLVLGGGGMRGMAHVGVLQALQRLGIVYDAVIGTSIGALVGAMAAAGYSIERMVDIVSHLQKEDYFRLNFVKFLMKGMRASSVYRGDLFRERLGTILPPGGFADLRVPFFCNCVRLETGGLVFWGTPGFEDVSIADAVYSSCCLPGVFEPYRRDGCHHMDGGMVDALPLRFAKQLRPDLIIAVDLAIKATFKHPNYRDRVLSTLYRAFEIAEEVITEQQLHMHADARTVLIQPKLGIQSRFDFAHVPEVMRAGEEEATRVLLAHAATRNLVQEDLPAGTACPVTPRDHVSIRIDALACIGCGNCQMVCETDAYHHRGDRAEVRKLSNYECTRDHACARNCPTGAIHLGNL
ncbi:MAG: patatin-like phospholipase family protein [Planctomycetota bacterium]